MHVIEILVWPCRIAEVALWLMDHQMNLEVSEAFGQYVARLPLDTSPRIRYDNVEHLAHVSCPVLVVHSPQDEIIPFSHAPKLHDAARPPRKLLEVDGSHNRPFGPWAARVMSAAEALAGTPGSAGRR